MTQQSHPLQNVTGLGSLKSIHGFSRFYRNNRFIISGMILVGIFSCSCIMLYGLLQDAQKGITSDGLGFTLGIAAFFILLWLFIIFWMMRDWLKNRDFAAALYEGGVATRDPQGMVQSVSWDQVEYMQPQRVQRRSRLYSYNLVCKDGRVVVLPFYLEGLPGLVQSVKQALSAQS